MMQLHQGYEEFEDRNTAILVIGPDNAERVKKYWEENNLKFYGIPDEEHKVLKLYGQKVDIFRLGRLPAQILVDTAGEHKLGAARHAVGQPRLVEEGQP